MMSATATLPYRATSGPSANTGDAVAIAVLSWAWAAVAVEPAGSARARWLAPHPSDARLAAQLCKF
jgi:hypothetical protein